MFLEILSTSHLSQPQMSTHAMSTSYIAGSEFFKFPQNAFAAHSQFSSDWYLSQRNVFSLSPDWKICRSTMRRLS